MSIDINMQQLKGTDGKLYILPSHLECIYGLMSFMKEVIYGSSEYFTFYETSNGKQSKTVSALGRHLKSLPAYSDSFSTDYTFSPLLTFFFDQWRKHAISAYRVLGCNPDAVSIKLFGDFVGTMRANARISKLKKLVADWESKPKKNMRRLSDFEAALFGRSARVMAVRLDFNYHKATFTPQEIDRIALESVMQKECDQADYLAGQDISKPRVIEGRIALEEVQKDRKRFFTNIKGKPSLFEHLLGYVWCIECGRAAGYHLHVMLFFDGSNVQKHEHIAQEIGKYWQNAITNGRGYFENCNLKKKKYGDSWALGAINHWDTIKREKLVNAMSYFCKTNQLVQVVPYAGCRLFGCGFIHRQRKVRGGRPRTKGAGKGDNQPL